MKSDYPLTLFYDAGCAVCALEMDALRARDHRRRLVFVDIAAPGFDTPPDGVSRVELAAEIHATRPDGSLLRGVEVLRQAYSAVGLGWLLRPTGWALLRPLFDAGYHVFARHRHAISRAAAPAIGLVRAARARALARRMRDCAGGACEQPPRH